MTLFYELVYALLSLHPIKRIQHQRKKIKIKRHKSKPKFRLSSLYKKAFPTYPTSYQSSYILYILYVPFSVYPSSQQSNQKQTLSILPKMNRGAAIFLCLLLVVMDITAGILGIEAEIAQNKVWLKKMFRF